MAIKSHSSKGILVPTYYINLIGEQLMTRSVDVNTWLNRSRIKQCQIAEPDQFIHLGEFKSLIIDAISLSKEPSLGLIVGKKIGLTSHGILGYAITASSSLRESVELFSRYLNTRTPLLRIEVKNIDDKTNESEDLLKIELHECYALDEVRVSFLESAIFTLYNLLMQVTQNLAPIVAISFPFPPPSYQHLYLNYFNIKAEFNKSVASITLKKSELDKPLLMADEASLKQAKILCELELIKQQNAELLVTKVRKYLLSFESGFPLLSEVSAYFNFSQRTFNRRLKSEDSGFSLILKNVREYKAINLLKNSNKSVQEIAFILGYTDIANFRKAFKQWQGVPPSEYRKSLANE